MHIVHTFLANRGEHSEHNEHGEHGEHDEYIKILTTDLYITLFY
jgi:hypothetical protein